MFMSPTPPGYNGNVKVNVDKVGAIASAVCAVHCVLTGFALGLLSLLGLGFVGSGWTELVFVLLVIGLGSVGVVHGIRKHHSYIPGTLFAIGLLCLSVGHFAFSHRGGVGSALCSVLAGLFLIAFNVLNLRLSSQCGCSHCRTGR